MTNGNLDIDIAKKVMGYHDLLVSPFNGALIGLPANRSRPKDGSTSAHVRILNFSTDITAAWLVVEKVHGWGGGGVLYLNLGLSDEGWGAQFYAWGASETCQVPRVYAQSAALAICLAALRAVSPLPSPPEPQ